VIGAGTSGLVDAGGRPMEDDDEGHQIGLGSHLVEDSDDNLAAVYEQVGITLTHSQRIDPMPFWDNRRSAAQSGPECPPRSHQSQSLQ